MGCGGGTNKPHASYYSALKNIRKWQKSQRKGLSCIYAGEEPTEAKILMLNGISASTP